MNSGFMYSIFLSMKDNYGLTGKTTGLIDELLEDSRDIKPIKDWIGSSYQSQYVGACSHAVHPIQTLQPREVIVKTSKIRHLMTHVERLPARTEILLHEEGQKFPNLSNLALQMRVQNQPNNAFQYCSVLRGCLGTKAPLHLVGDDAMVIMWKKRHLDKFYIMNPRSIPPTIDIHQWSIVLFWNDLTSQKGDQQHPQPDNDQDIPPHDHDMDEELPGATLHSDEEMSQPDEDMELPDIPSFPPGFPPNQGEQVPPNPDTRPNGPEHFDISDNQQ